MKKFFILFTALFFFGSTTNADTAYQANKPVVCDSLSNITKTMKDQYGEEPVWFGADLESNGNYVMLSNFQTKTWTFVQFTENWACVLGVGTGASPLKVGLEV